jgi:hypothetical protein
MRARRDFQGVPSHVGDGADRGTEMGTEMMARRGEPVAEPEACRSLRELTGVPGSDPDAVGRAIEDLERSGCRPLRSRPEAPEPPALHGGRGDLRPVSPAR